jgi:peptide/nickel transport system substrate-binding protein
VLREKLSARYEGWWWQGCNNPAFDDALAVAERTVDPESRADLYRRIHRIVHQDAPWLFLYVPRHVYAVGPRLRGRWQPRPDGIVDLRTSRTGTRNE